MCYPSGGGGGGQDALAQSNYTTNRINWGKSLIDIAFRGFDDPYYADFEKRTLDMALPDIARQKKDANDQTLYGLARSGNLDSSTAAKQYADVNTRNNQAIQNATDTAHTAAENLRGDVESERNNLTNQLVSTMDPMGTYANAGSQAAVLTRPPTYSPVTNIFADLTGQIAANEQARRLNQPGWGFGLTSPGVSAPIGGPSVTQIS